MIAALYGQSLSNIPNNEGLNVPLTADSDIEQMRVPIRRNPLGLPVINTGSKDIVLLSIPWVKGHLRWGKTLIYKRLSGTEKAPSSWFQHKNHHH